MILERIKTPGIAHVAYLLADGTEAALVDPARDIGRYLEVLRARGLTLRCILETHRQEDFVMGGAALRAATGAGIVAGDHSHFRHADLQLADGAGFALGALTLQALHVPGHTPESMCYGVFLPESRDRALGVFTGDALFIGDTGRTDLADPGATAENAGRLYDALHAKVFPLGDQALVLPAHGAGSVCGANIADRDHSTLGVERHSNPVALLSREAFARHKVNERLARPPYFTLMEEVNLAAGRPPAERAVPWLPPAEFRERSREGLIVDTREPEAFAGGHVPGSLNIWLDGLGRFAGWIPEHTRVWLIVEDGAALQEAVLALARIGHDRVEGALAGSFGAWRNAGYPLGMSATIAPSQLRAQLERLAVLDVREIAELEDDGHIPGARHIFVGDLEGCIDTLDWPRDKPIVVTCSVGHRAGLAVSVLRRHGWQNVYNLLGGMTAWRRLELPLRHGPDARAGQASSPAKATPPRGAAAQAHE